MATVSGGDKFLKHLDKLGQVKRETVLQAGFMADSVYDSGTPVALVAAVQDFGSVSYHAHAAVAAALHEYGEASQGIPPRPFFRNAIAKGKSSWPPIARALIEEHDFDVPAALIELGRVIEGDIKRSINETNTPALAPATIKRKGFSKPLIETSHMLNSVTSRLKP